VNWQARLDLFRHIIADEDVYGKKLELIIGVPLYLFSLVLFLRSDSLVSQGYFEPLRDKSILNAEELQSIFCNIETLSTSHKVCILFLRGFLSEISMSFIGTRGRSAKGKGELSPHHGARLVLARCRGASSLFVFVKPFFLILAVIIFSESCS